MANSLSPQEIDELAQMVQDRFGGNIDELRAKIHNILPFIGELSRIADHPDTMRTVLSDLTTRAASTSDRAAQGNFAMQALCVLLFTRLRRGPNAPPEQTAHEGCSQPFGYNDTALTAQPQPPIKQDDSPKSTATATSATANAQMTGPNSLALYFGPGSLSSMNDLQSLLGGANQTFDSQDALNRASTPSAARPTTSPWPLPATSIRPQPQSLTTSHPQPQLQSQPELQSQPPATAVIAGPVNDASDDRTRFEDNEPSPEYGNRRGDAFNFLPGGLRIHTRGRGFTGAGMSGRRGTDPGDASGNEDGSGGRGPGSTRRPGEYGFSSGRGRGGPGYDPKLPWWR